MSYNKPNILIVDDVPRNIQIIGNILKECDYDIEFATNGKDAIEWIKTKKFDLVLLDIMMPEMDGYEVFETIKRTDSSNNISVIFISAKSDSESIIKGLELGAVDYIIKPFHKKELLARIKTHLTILHQKNELEKANAFKSKLLSVIGHDLRDPIGSLKSYVDVYLEYHPQTDENIVIFMKEVAGIAENAFNLLENLLSWAKSQTGRIVFNPQVTDIYAVVSDASNLLANVAGKKRIIISNNIEKNTFAYFDTEMISAVIRNLIANAIKFSYIEGKIKIESSEIEKNDEKKLVISVIDNGVGISKENLSMLFNQETHLTTYGTNNEKGSGLGLKICHEFIEMNGGEIFAGSNEKTETSFSFTLPMDPLN